METPELLYRFRPLVIIHETKINPEKTVVQELKNQEIYFSSLEELNDPMDGYQSACFEGDDILWTNFIKFYLLNLAINMSFIEIADDTNRIDVSKKLFVFQTKRNLPDGILSIYKELIRGALENSLIKSFLDVFIKKRKLYMSQLTVMLELLHPVLSNICKKALKLKLFPDMEENAQKVLVYTQQLLDVLKQGKQGWYDSMTEEAYWTGDVYLSTKYSFRHRIIERRNIKENIIDYFANYPKSFLAQFVKSIYPEYAVACFTRNDENSSMWGHYAEGHKGVCLIFRPIDQAIIMSDKRKYTFYPVSYGLIPSEINVFENLGTFAQKDIDEDWLTLDSKISDYFKKCFGDENFRKNYWGNFNSKVNFKFLDWEYEDEFRLISNRLFYGDKVQKLQKYDFNILKGVIFGVNTPLEIKIAIIEVIEEKCREYEKYDFIFKQAEYSQIKNKMHAREINSLRFNN